MSSSMSERTIPQTKVQTKTPVNVRKANKRVYKDLKIVIDDTNPQEPDPEPNDESQIYPTNQEKIY